MEGHCAISYKHKGECDQHAEHDKCLNSYPTGTYYVRRSDEDSSPEVTGLSIVRSIPTRRREFKGV